MTLDPRALLDTVVSYALASGLFAEVNGHEPKSAPPGPVACACWVQSIGPVKASGLAATSGLLVITQRVYVPMLSEPQDDIDPTALDAVSALLAAYSGDFTFGSSVRMVDLLGAYSPGLRADAGYLESDRKHFRVMDITIPLVVNDIWTQAE